MGVRSNIKVVAMTDRFNFVSDWVVNVLCTADNPKTRVTYFQKFLRIADELRNLGNFNGVLEIMSAIRRGPVDRLKKSFNVCLKTCVKFIYPSNCLARY